MRRLQCQTTTGSRRRRPRAHTPHSTTMVTRVQGRRSWLRRRTAPGRRRRAKTIAAQWGRWRNRSRQHYPHKQSPSGPGCLISDIQPTTTGTATSSHPNIDHAHTTRSPSAPSADEAVSRLIVTLPGSLTRNPWSFRTFSGIIHRKRNKKQRIFCSGTQQKNTLTMTDIWAELLPIYNEARRPR